jgi:glycosyltransferase involved in cell wall biosynthesis
MIVVAVIPARDERATIAATVRAAAAVAGVTRVLVVDDASSDGTAEEARAAGADVAVLAANVGKGAALEAGLAAAGTFDVVLLLDADLADSAAEASALLAPVTAGEADMAVALIPHQRGSGGFGFVKRLASRGIRRLGSGFEAQAPLSGQRALNAAAADAVRPIGFGFGAEVAMTVRALRAGLRVVEVPAAMTHRATGRDLAGFSHRGRQFVEVRRALRALARESR